MRTALMCAAGLFAGALVCLFVYLCFDGAGGLTTWKRRVLFTALAGFICYRALLDVFNPGL